MKQTLSFAQKGLILDASRKKILITRYLTSKFVSENVAGRLTFPGGQIEFGEEPDESFVREVVEETGITIIPSVPIDIWYRIYNKEGTDKQIIGLVRLAHYKSGEIKEPDVQKETKLEKSRWIDLKKINIEEFVDNEQPALLKFFDYQKKNPFVQNLI